MRSVVVFRLCRAAHAWAGAALSALLVTLALSGVALIFKDDYVRLVEPAARSHPNLSVAGLGRICELAETHFRAEDLSALVFASEGFGLHKAYFVDGRAAYLAPDGSVVDVWEKNGRLEDWVFDLHHHLLAGETGALVAGTAGLAACVLVLTGLIAVWPMRRGLRRGLAVSAPTRGQLRSLHRNLGVVSAIPLLVLLLTGAAMIFPQTSQTLLRAAAPAPTPPVGPGRVDWPKAVSLTAEAFPQATLRVAIWPRQGRPAVIRAQQPTEWHPNGRTIAHFDPASTRLIALEDATQVDAARRAYNAIYPVHAAGAGGRIYDGFVAFTGLALAALSGLGLVTFLRLARAS